ncbi:MAG TPA: hypothetical protein VH934_08115 [Xanthobacteraceae bacterium]|jgi:hypothetical protein
MSDEVIAFSAARHPAQHRERVSLSALFFGLFAAPIVWAGNLMVTYGLATHACYPGAWPLDEISRGFGFAWWLIVGCYVVALAICASAGVVAFRNWSITGQETEGHVHHLIERGEGRTRYLSVIGMAFATLFFAATLFGAIVLIIEPLCAS